MVDYADGIDENSTYWSNRTYPTFTIYGSDQCKDVYICPSGHPLYVEIPFLCDETLSCHGGSEICKIAALASPQISYIPAKVKNVNHLHYCILGLQDIYVHITPCEHRTYPTETILGTRPNYLFLPIEKVNCDYTHGQQYVYLSCSGRCQKLQCPITTTPLFSFMSSNILRNKTYSLSGSKNLVLVERNAKGFKVRDLFVCGNGNCVPYNKVCNLVDDCDDGTDEESCGNHFTCNVKSNFSKSGLTKVALHIAGKVVTTTFLICAIITIVNKIANFVIRDTVVCRTSPTYHYQVFVMDNTTVWIHQMKSIAAIES